MAQYIWNVTQLNGFKNKRYLSEGKNVIEGESCRSAWVLIQNTAYISRQLTCIVFIMQHLWWVTFLGSFRHIQFFTLSLIVNVLCIARITAISKREILTIIYVIKYKIFTSMNTSFFIILSFSSTKIPLKKIR